MNEERERGVCHFTVHTDLMGSGTHFLCLKLPVTVSLESKCDFPSNVNRAEEFWLWMTIAIRVVIGAKFWELIKARGRRKWSRGCRLHRLVRIDLRKWCSSSSFRQRRWRYQGHRWSSTKIRRRKQLSTPVVYAIEIDDWVLHFMIWMFHTSFAHTTLYHFDLRAAINSNKPKIWAKVADGLAIQ